MADALDLAIARGPPQQDLGGQISKLPDSYWAGLDEAYKRRNQEAFAGGIPKGPDGQPDWAAISSTILQKGGVPGTPSAVETGRLDIERRQLAEDAANAKFRATGTGGVPPLAASPEPSSAQPTPSPPTSARVPGGDNGQTTIMAAVGPHFGDADAGRVALAVASRLGVDPNAPLPPEKFAQAQQLAQSAAAARRPAAAPQPPTNPGDNAPITRPATSAQPVNDPNSPIPPGVDPQAYLKGLRERAATGTKEGRVEVQKQIQEVGQWMRDRSSVEIEARKAEANKSVETLSKLADDGIDARGHSAQLDAIQQLGRKVAYGIIPKVQSILGHYGIETKGLSDIQAYERAVDFMAPQLRPIGSGRLLQNELNSFKSALGGLMTTPEGREISVNNLRLLSQYKEAIGRIAADTSLTAGERVNKIYAVQPPHLQTDVPKASTPASGPPRFSSPADVTAAINAKKLKSGDTFLDAKGTTRRVP